MRRLGGGRGAAERAAAIDRHRFPDTVAERVVTSPERPNHCSGFRVDAQVQILNARRYLATCGGGPECYSVAGSVCLSHIAGFRPSLRRTYDPRRDKPAARPGSSSG